MKKFNKFSKFSILFTLLINIPLLLSCQPSDQFNNKDRKQVTILGVMIGKQREKLEQALAPFTEETGIEVVYEGTDAFATTLSIRVDSGNPPDLAIFPQPGLMADFAREGKLIPLTNFMTSEQLQDAYPETWLNLGSVDDIHYGVWYRVSVKSLVWYNPKAFEKNGYKIPKTWDEMMALSESLVSEGKTPWCIGMESGDATGWVGTDWIEEIMLRTVGGEAYDQWIAHQIPFTNNSVKNAFETFGRIVRNKKYIYGGMVGVLSTPFGDSIQGLFGDNPNCYLHRQATFITSFLPQEINTAEDVDIFPLPPINSDQSSSILVAGDVFAMFNNTPESRKLMEYITSEVPHKIAVDLGGHISPRNNITVDLYSDQLMQKQAKILADAEVIRFDGSDMMPGAVGTGTFWSGMVEYVGGTDVEKVLRNIDSSWPD